MKQDSHTNRADPTILALDGGGTYTRAVIITREGHVSARAEGPGCNPFDRPDWAECLRTLLERLPHHSLRAAGLGMAGYDAERPSCTAQDNLVRAALGPDVALCLENDVETAHRGAFADGPGIFILAGTGSVVMARATDGRPARAGAGAGCWEMRAEVTGLAAKPCAMPRIISTPPMRQTPLLPMRSCTGWACQRRMMHRAPTMPPLHGPMQPMPCANGCAHARTPAPP